MPTTQASKTFPVQHPDPYDNWLMFRKPRPQAAIRLLCFHHAGGAALAYRSWVDRMPAFVDVCPVQLPGRSTRMNEEPGRNVDVMVASLLRAIEPLLDRPLALFGHSMGATLAFAAAQVLERKQAQVVHLFAAGRRAPIPEYKTDLHRLTDAGLEAYLRQLGGTPDIVFQEPDLRANVFSLLRADFEMNDRFTAVGRLQNVPICAMGGNQDEHVPVAALDHWRGLTDVGFNRHLFQGGHFFVRDEETAVIQHVSSTLAASVEYSL